MVPTDIYTLSLHDALPISAGSTVSGLGPHTITITATDDTGNDSTCTATLTVGKATRPDLSHCAAKHAVNALEKIAPLVPNLTSGDGATANCDPSVTITHSP